MELSEVADLLDDLRDAEGRAERAEACATKAEALIADAIRSLPPSTHLHDGRPCTSGLDHLPPEPRT